jgi:hypothetical protein
MNARTLPPVVEERLPEHIIAAFVSLRGCSQTDLLSGQSRTRMITRARNELWWLLRDLTSLSLAKIGALFEGRDATTIQSGINGIADLIAGSDDYRAQMQQMRSFILAHAARDSGPIMDASTVIARRVLIDKRHFTSEDAQALALSIVSVAAILRAGELTDAEARVAALTIIRNGGRATHGN